MCGSRGQYALDKILRSRNHAGGLKIKVFQTIVRPVVLWGSEIWTLTQEDEQMISIWKRKVLRIIFEPLRDSKDITTSYTMFMMNLAKSNRIRWARHLERMEGNRLPKMAQAATYENQRKGRSRPTWKDGPETDLIGLGRQNYKSDARGREKWRNVA